jgi:hypothetical protein
MSLFFLIFAKDMEVLFEKNFARISYETDKDLMFLELIGNIKHENYKETFDTLLEFAAQKSIKKLLVNQATLEKSGMDSKAWLITSWLPRVKKTLGEDIKVALILAKNLFTKIGGEYVVGAVRMISKFEVRTFSSLDDGRAWLMKGEE